MTEKRILIASALSALLMVWYAKLMARHQPVPTHPTAIQGNGPLNGTKKLIVDDSFLLEQEDVTFIESDRLRLEIGKRSGQIRKATLKEFKDLSSGQAIRFGTDQPLFRISVDGKPLVYQLADSGEKRIAWNAKDNKDKEYNISYELNNYNYLLKLELNSINIEKEHGEAFPLEIISSWTKGDALGDRYNQLETVLLTDRTAQWQREYLRYFRQRVPRSVPRGTKLITISDRYFCQSYKPSVPGILITLHSSKDGAAVVNGLFPVPVSEDGSVKFSAEIYIGSRDYFHLKESGFEKAFPVGFLGQVGLGLLLGLSAIARITHNYGIAVILFSILITCFLAPFTLVSLKSMKKMQQLKPQMDKIMARHKDNPQKANLEVLALYKENKVSPLSGCLPMLLQFPILMAMFGAISHFIELRGKSFLWIRDLSLPDRLAALPVSIPLIGNEVNALPVIMAIVMFFQSKKTQQQMPQSSGNPMASMMSGPMMSVLFGVMFYSFPSGLVLYWLTNSIMSILWLRLVR